MRIPHLVLGAGALWAVWGIATLLPSSFSDVPARADTESDPPVAARVDDTEPGTPRTSRASAASEAARDESAKLAGGPMGQALRRALAEGASSALEAAPVEAAEALGGGFGEPDAPPLAERMAQDEERWRNETRDPDWAYRVEKTLHELVTERGYEGLFGDVRCRATLCRLEIERIAPRELVDLRESAAELGGELTVAPCQQGEACGDTQLVVYLAR